MKRFLAVTLLLLGCPEKKAAPGFELANRVAASAREKLPEAKVAVVSEDEVLVKLGETETTIGLDNIKLSCAASEDACVRAIEASVGNIKTLSPKKGEKLDQKQILLTLKTREFLENVDTMMKEKVADKFESNRLARTPLVADLVIVYVLDAPTGMRMLSAGDLKDNELTLEKVDALARANLSAAFAELTPMEELGKGMFTNTNDENYASAMLVLPELWAPLSKKMKGGPLLVAVPARNRMFAVSGKDKESVEILKLMVAKALETEDHALSGTVLEWTAKGFKEWKP